MITEGIKNLMDFTIKDINWECEDFVIFFQTQLQEYNRTITKNTLRTIHKKYIDDFTGNNKFINFSIKNKDAKYYLVRGWSSEHITKTLNLPIYNYLPIAEIITDEELKNLYSEFSMNELSSKLNIEYSRLQDYIKSNITATRNISQSCVLPSTLEKKKALFLEKYGVENPSQALEIKEKRKSTVLNKFGVSNVFQSPEIIEKIDATCYKKYGKRRYTQTDEYLDDVKRASINKYEVSHYTQHQEIKEKTKQTNIARYGVPSYLQLQKSIDGRKQYFLDNYGVENPSQVSKFQEKKKQTNLERYNKEHYFWSEDYLQKSFETNIVKYGYKYPMQNAKVFELSRKNIFRRKQIEKNNGDILYLQGYEPIVYSTLLDFFTEEDIETKASNMPIFMYEYDGVSRRYYPDFFIVKNKLIVEVKSTYTYELQKEQNIAKKESVENQGYNFEFIILEKEFIDDATYRRIRDFRNYGN